MEITFVDVCESSSHNMQIYSIGYFLYATQQSFTLVRKTIC